MAEISPERQRGRLLTFIPLYMVHGLLVSSAIPEEEIVVIYYAGGGCGESHCQRLPVWVADICGSPVCGGCCSGHRDCLPAQISKVSLTGNIYHDLATSHKKGLKGSNLSLKVKCFYGCLCERSLSQ